MVLLGVLGVGLKSPGSATAVFMGLTLGSVHVCSRLMYLEEDVVLIVDET